MVVIAKADTFFWQYKPFVYLTIGVLVMQNINCVYTVWKVIKRDLYTVVDNFSGFYTEVMLVLFAGYCAILIIDGHLHNAGSIS